MLVSDWKDYLVSSICLIAEAHTSQSNNLSSIAFDYTEHLIAYNRNQS